MFLVSDPTLNGILCATKIILLLSLVLFVHVLVMYLIIVVCACVLTSVDGCGNSFLILLFTIVGILSRTLF